MGTHAITFVHDGDGDAPMIIAMYRHFDGNFESHGRELMDFLNTKVLVNGISSQDNHLDIANGMGDLAAQLVCHFKKKYPVGQIYLSDPSNPDEEYIYRIYAKNGKICLRSINDESSHTHEFDLEKACVT